MKVHEHNEDVYVLVVIVGSVIVTPQKPQLFATDIEQNNISMVFYLIRILMTLVYFTRILTKVKHFVGKCALTRTFLHCLFKAYYYMLLFVFLGGKVGQRII